MMPISAFYLDKEPPNVASVSSLLQARRQETASSAAPPPPPAPKDEPSPAPAPASAASAAASAPPPQSATISPGEESGSAAMTFGEVEDQTTGPEGEPITADDGKSGGTAGESQSRDVQEQDGEEETAQQAAAGQSAVAVPEAEHVGSATTAEPSPGSESMEDVSLNSVGGDQSPMRRTGTVDDDDAGEEVDLS